MSREEYFFCIKAYNGKLVLSVHAFVSKFYLAPLKLLTNCWDFPNNFFLRTRTTSHKCKFQMLKLEWSGRKGRKPLLLIIDHLPFPRKTKELCPSRVTGAFYSFEISNWHRLIKR